MKNEDIEEYIRTMKGDEKITFLDVRLCHWIEKRRELLKSFTTDKTRGTFEYSIAEYKYIRKKMKSFRLRLFLSSLKAYLAISCKRLRRNIFPSERAAAPLWLGRH